MLVRQNMLVVGGDAASVQQMSVELDAGATQFSATDFGQRIVNVYSQGTEIVVAANLGQILNATHTQPQESNALSNSGFNDVKYLIATRGETSNHGDNRITVEFSGPRRGSRFLAGRSRPSGLTRLCFRQRAGAAFSFVAKQP